MKYSVQKNDIHIVKEEILRLWRSNFSLQEPEKRFQWMYTDNPAGPPDLWTLHDDQSNIVGCIGVARRFFFWNGEIITAGQTIDFSVDKQHRTLRPALQLQRCIIENMKNLGYDILYGFPNKKSIAIQKRTGFQTIGVIPRWTIVIRSQYIVSRYIQNTLISALVSRVLDTVIRLYHFLLQPKSMPKHYNCQISSCLPDDFLISFEKSETVSSMMGERNAAFLTWRFSEFPTACYQYFILKQFENHLGYIVFSESDRQASIVDFYAKNIEQLKRLFREFIRIQRKKNNDSVCVDYLGNNNISDILLSLGFQQRPSEEFLLVAIRPDRKDRIPCETNSLYITLADRDV